MKADCGSYYVTMYITTKPYDEKNRRENEKKDRK